MILLDEPTSALDPISTLKIEELIGDLKHGFTIALVTHNMQQPARVADQVAFFYLGELVEVSSAALKMTMDLERMGDYAANVAKRSIVLAQFALPYSMAGLGHMTRLVQENLKLTVDAIGENHADKAMQVWRSDLMIDDIYTVIFRELVTYMMEDPRNITPCTHLLFIAKNLERIGDHATNTRRPIR